MTPLLQTPAPKFRLLTRLLGNLLISRAQLKKHVSSCELANNKLVNQQSDLSAYLPSNSFAPLAIRLNGLAADNSRQQSFKQLFNCQTLPISYLFIESYRYLGQLLLQAKLPSGLLGLIHISASFEEQQPVSWQQPFDLILSLIGSQASDKGLVYRIRIEMLQNNNVCLVSEHQLLDKFKDYQRGERRRQFDVANALSAVAYQPLTPVLARKYAKLSGDYNPIHLQPWLAKMLGMHACVIHGMYQMHWALVNTDKSYQKVTAHFNKACYLPRKVSLVEQAGNKLAVFSNHFTERHMQLTLE
ncbi:MaoC/PaaZ C-terminal domain-containing protein [Thalassotalea montiporae]